MKKEKLKKQFEVLREKRKQLFEIVAPVDAALLNQLPAEGKWSILQILYHVKASEAGTLRYIEKKLSFSPDGLPNSPFLSGAKLLLLEITLRSPLKFKAPKGLDVFPEKLALEEIKEDWDRSDEGFLNLIDRLDEHQFGWQLFKHPIIGRLDMQQTIKFMISHFDHHARQIKRLTS
ncbi:DinB family protein [uncultured Imperialibacter sp.]|uniref:DinB family protein n=1 Tax=uncultured Imperialibacter sp. TaxID=1672639 RepID=UPI0030DC5D1A|tara:strand:+ start:12338 stop:12865 length:528 start_codon:yes stop_codon:yes gene_type:complete